MVKMAENGILLAFSIDNEKEKRIKSLLNLNDIDNLSVYFDKYSVELKNNTLNYYIKSVIKSKN